MESVSSDLRIYFFYLIQIFFQNQKTSTDFNLDKNSVSEFYIFDMSICAYESGARFDLHSH